jgi:putative FmdB family regulatory protein
MPLYEYRCEACGQPEEKLESLSAPEAHACPACGTALGMKRQVSVAAFALAGGGWYKGAASEPKAAVAKGAETKTTEPRATEPKATDTATAAPEAPKSAPGCGTGGCGCH